MTRPTRWTSRWMPVDNPDEPASRDRDGNVASVSSRSNELALCSDRMVSVARSLLDLVLFVVFAALYLGAIYVFASYRLRRARASSNRFHVPRADPWLSAAVIAVSGASLLGLRQLIT